MRREIEAAIKTAVRELYRLDLRSPLEHPKQDSFGDFASPAALEVARETNVDPLEIANQLKIKIVGSLKDWVAELQVDERGFLNFWLSDAVLAKETVRAGK